MVLSVPPRSTVVPPVAVTLEELPDGNVIVHGPAPVLPEPALVPTS
ncbi:hypothetical protein [Streptomyces sp. NPDC050504]